MNLKRILMALAVLLTTASLCAQAAALRAHQRTPVRHLPPGAVTVVLQGVKYFVGNGIYYRASPSGYLVVAPPAGAVVKRLPAGTRPVFIKGRTYYRSGTVWYLWDQGQKAYLLTDAPGVEVSAEIPAVPAAVAGSESSPGVEGVFPSLPKGAKSVVIDGIQYFEKDGLRFLPTSRDGAVVYVVVK
ncbi:DUF6515 family protein [Photobacterium sp. SDRW27]|uniref:DUF6515 family protein n=1 Tax=Photobacterium obscurum TaxID=2829490 RepID=UPI002244B75B|nr:DUF6515 family protein [Photobacterium obscurum]MCW8328819.1 DUF6515 family protein [Photobacterium obscurum]